MADVFVRDADGNVLRGPASDAAAAVAAGGTILTDEQAAQAEKEAKYGGTFNTAAAGALNAADALSFGTAPGLVKQGVTGLLGAEAGGRVGQAWKDVSDVHPYASGLGMLGGALVPALFTGGESLGVEGEGLLGAAGRVLGAPSELAAGLGEEAAGGIAARLGEGLGARLATKATQGAVTGLTEGGLYGLGSAYSDAALNDEELTGERMLAGAGKGALAGGVLGGGLGAGGELLGTGARKAVSALGDKVEGLSGKLEGLSNELRYSSTGAKTPEIRKLEASGLTTRDVGEWMNKELPAFNGGKAPLSQSAILQSAERASEDAGTRIGGKMTELDRTAKMLGATPTASTIIERMQSEVAAPLAEKIGQEAAAARVQGIVDRIGEKLGVAKADGALVDTGSASFSDLWQIRRDLDELGFKERKVLDNTAATTEIRNLRRIVDSELRAQGEAVAGKEWRAAFDAAHRDMRMAERVSDAVEPAMQRMSGNRGVSLTDTIAAGAGLSALGPKGLLLAGANKLLRTYGDAVGASIASKAAKMEAIRGIADGVSEKLRGGIAKFVQGGETGTERLAARSFAEQSKRVQALASNPQLLAASSEMPHADAAPGIAQQYASKQAQAVAYLNQQLPRGFVTRSPILATDTAPIPRAQQIEWLARAAVVEDPSTVIHSMSDGTITQAQVDTLKAVYPRMYEDLQQSTMEELVNAQAEGRDVGYKRRLAIGTLLDIPADATQEPSFITAQLPPEKSSQDAPLPSAVPPRAVGASNGMTEAQRLEMT